MNNRVTVADLMRQLSALPQDARVVLHGSMETYDGFSHPWAGMSCVDGTVIICEQDEPEGWEDPDQGLDARLMAA
jgi:hypothetical protein